jgi:hypothetical protein
MSFKMSFKCEDCPENNGKMGCPVWWELILKNDVGEQKIEKGCGFQLMPYLITMTVKQSMHSTYAAYDMRNKVVKNVGKVIQAVQEKLVLPEELLNDIDTAPLLIEGEIEQDG